jgi:hypothetical protein
MIRPLAVRLMAAALLLMPDAALPDSPDPLQRFRQTAATQYRYEETRTLELMAAPWKGKGYLLSSPDGTLVKLQLSPERIIMAISGERMMYYDSAHGQRQSAPLGQGGPMAEQVGAFRAILQGRTAELRSGYDIRTETRDKRWTLHLAGKARKAGEPPPVLEISGDENLRRRHILIRQPDGEKTEYALEKSAEGKHLEPWIKDLVAEASGNPE